MSSVAPRNPLFINTILLGGGTLDKVAAARAAGFDQIELWRQDVEAYGNHRDSLPSVLKQRGLGLTDYQVLLDFAVKADYGVGAGSLRLNYNFHVRLLYCLRSDSVLKND